MLTNRMLIWRAALTRRVGFGAFDLHDCDLKNVVYIHFPRIERMTLWGTAGRRYLDWLGRRHRQIVLKEVSSPLTLAAPRNSAAN